MALVQEGDPRAFEMLYDRHGGPAFSLAYRMVGNRVTAEDISRRPSCRSGAAGCATSRIAAASGRGCWASFTTARSTRCGATWSTTSAGQAPRASRSASRRRSRPTSRWRAWTRRASCAAPWELPDEQCKVIELAYFGGFSHSQIAEMLEMPIGTVKGRMRLGLDKLRRQLAEGAV